MEYLTETQKKKLFSMAEKAEKSGEKLTDVFKAFAKKTGRCAGSIRNLYYRELAGGRKCNLKVRKNVLFEEAEEIELFKTVLDLKKQTGSVRKAVFALAGGDRKLALRYQNKFSNMIKKKREDYVCDLLSSADKCAEDNNRASDRYFIKEALSATDKLKIKNEIQNILLKITKKCAAEKEELFKKLKEYEKYACDEELKAKKSSENEKSYNRDFISAFFLSEKNKKSL